MRLATHSVGKCKQAQIICSHQSQVKCWRNVKKVTHCLRCFCGSESSGMATKVFLPLDAAHVRKHTRLSPAAEVHIFWSRGDWERGYNISSHKKYLYYSGRCTGGLIVLPLAILQREQDQGVTTNEWLSISTIKTCGCNHHKLLP